jgi:hypothetical protein
MKSRSSSGLPQHFSTPQPLGIKPKIAVSLISELLQKPKEEKAEALIEPPTVQKKITSKEASDLIELKAPVDFNHK